MLALFLRVNISYFNSYTMSCKEEKLLSFDPEHIFFTSDTHFGHENIIRYCNRPFKNAEEMDKALIRNWNNVVGKDDIVFHLGDFAIGGSAIWNNALNALNGRIILVKGNHDLKNLRTGYTDKFEMIVPQLLIEVEGNSIYLNHYPFLCYSGMYKGHPVLQLFGHIHSGPLSQGEDFCRLPYLLPTQYDVGVDNNNFTPISYREVEKIIQRQLSKK